MVCDETNSNQADIVNQNNKTNTRLARLTELLDRQSNMLIVMQDNPDPDSIAAAVALRCLAHGISRVQCSIAYGGRIGRAENRALVAYLDLNLRLCDEIDFKRFDLVAMVDSQPATGNNSLPEGTVPDIIIDHHKCGKAARKAKFTDIRSRYGSTSTILFEYIKKAQIHIDRPLATALLYGIRSDTQDLGRQSTTADIEAMSYLFTLANKKKLGAIQRGRVRRSYFRMLSRALENAVLCDEAITAELGDIDNADIVPEIADLLLRHEGVHWTMCTGLSEKKMLISIRTDSEQQRADKLAEKLLTDEGSAGGHATYAGGQINLPDISLPPDKLHKKLHRKFLRLVRLDPGKCEELIP